MNFVFTEYAKKQWRKLPGDVQERVRKKLMTLKSSLNLKKQFKTVSALEPATHRLRIGSYRLLMTVDFDKKESLILKIAHRREIYR